MYQRKIVITDIHDSGRVETREVVAVMTDGGKLVCGSVLRDGEYRPICALRGPMVQYGTEYTEQPGVGAFSSVVPATIKRQPA